MSRLIVVSNRVPSVADGRCAGGLAVALKSTLEKEGGTWIGWSGAREEAPSARAKCSRLDGFNLGTIDLSPLEYQGYYERCANSSLWPLFHGRVDLARFDEQSYAQYRKVNRRFARAVQATLDGDDIVWAHDYHLIPLGLELRRLGVRAPLGFFLHTPFPPLATLAALPWHMDLLAQLCAYDVVGFQTSECLKNFRDAVERQSSNIADLEYVRNRQRPMKAGHYPISIDTAAFAALAASPETARRQRRLERVLRGQRWAVGVERLDYTKGLPERFLAFETLLEETPGYQGRLSLVQIAAPSRETVAEYQATQDRLSQQAGRINARLGGFDWTPIRYLNQSFDHHQIAALYRVSSVGLVTPLNDGMNLVAKEYVAAQDPDDPGVLVLSRFAGAAEELSDAVLVNPYDRTAMARAFREAFEMPRDERRARWTRMMAQLEANDIHCWRDRFLDDLLSQRERTPEPTLVKSLDAA